LLPLWARDADEAARDIAKNAMRKAWQSGADVMATNDMFCAEYTATFKRLAADK
jgi:hypothetical protein